MMPWNPVRCVLLTLALRRPHFIWRYHRSTSGADICPRTEGPQFSTRAESHLYRSWGGTVINMSTLPEAKLAAEAEIAYQVILMSTDYDVRISLTCPLVPIFHAC